MPSGKLLTMSIARANTTAFIKSKIQELKNIPVDEQHLYYSNKELQDGFTLIESNIKNESVLVFERAKKAFLLYLNYVWRALLFFKKFFNPRGLLMRRLTPSPDALAGTPLPTALTDENSPAGHPRTNT